MLLWNTAHELDTAAGLRVWRGWVIGDVLQAVLVVAPLLRLAGPRARAWIDHQFATPPHYEVTYTRAALVAAVTFSLIAVLVFVGIYELEASLDLDPTARTASGQLLVPRLREMQLYLGVLVAALTVAASVFSTVLARMGERQRGLSRRESLTGCFNRRAFYELFPREVDRARRLGQGVADRLPGHRPLQEDQRPARPRDGGPRAAAALRPAASASSARPTSSSAGAGRSS